MISTAEQNRQSIIEYVQDSSIRLNNLEDLASLLEPASRANYVLLGEATHGTSEFYTFRADISKRLIEHGGFRFIAVEGDWPSCYEVNRFVKHYDGAPQSGREVLQAFDRWPTWMWANSEVLELMEWLRAYNKNKPMRERVGFYGLDMYSLWESMEAIIEHLEKQGYEKELEQARAAFACFEPYEREGQTYGVSAAFLGESCEEEVLQLLEELHQTRTKFSEDAEGALSAELNALVALNAERYYRSMVRSDSESWNIRDQHMAEALERLMRFHGDGSKAIVWEHNTHIGDARATDMADDGMVNVGQLVREAHGEEAVFAVGFGTYRGTVIAGSAWGSPLATLQLPPARRGSWEELLHAAGGWDKILLLRKEDPLLGHEVLEHRAIGVVYHPGYERGNYVPTLITRRYDAFVHVEESNALHPITTEKVPAH
jgi:erythromycin esterase-like protein